MAKSKHRKKVAVHAKDDAVVDQAILTIKNGLKWKREVKREGNDYEIISYPADRIHVITLPSQGKPEKLNELHELCHAHFAEFIHPLFSGSGFHLGTEDGKIQACTGVLRSVTDWFVEEMQHLLATGSYKRQLVNDLNWFIGSLAQEPHTETEYLSTVAMLCAQSERYLNREVKVDGELAILTQTFLSVDPSNPTLEKLESLINKCLMALKQRIGRELQVECVWDETEYVWKFI